MKDIITNEIPKIVITYFLSGEESVNEITGPCFTKGYNWSYNQYQS